MRKAAPQRAAAARAAAIPIEFRTLEKDNLDAKED